MKIRWRFRCYPTEEQERHLSKVFGCVRFVYNWGVEVRTKAFKDGKSIGYHQTSAMLTELKKQPDKAWLKEVSSVPTQQALRNLQTAFRNFFEKRTEYPSFKKKSGQQSAEYTRSAFRFEVGNQRLLLAGIGRLKVRFSRRIPVEPSTVTVIKKPSGKYFVSFVVDIEPEILPKTGKTVGVDFGVNRLATLSTGKRIPNPKHFDRYRKRLKRQQQALARKQRGSKRRERQKVRVAKIHEKIAESRKDTLIKLASGLVRRFDTVCIEDLNLRGMVKNHALARSLSDAGIGTAIRLIEAKAAMHGKTVVKIDRWFPSSKMCSSCGALQKDMLLSVRRWTCPVCGTTHDRDHNAAKNILAVGHTATGRGAGVRPDVATAAEGSLP